jgi:hypothetical protein
MRIEVEEEIDLSTILLNEEFVKSHVNIDNLELMENSTRSIEETHVQDFDKTNPLITQSRRRKIDQKIPTKDVLMKEPKKLIENYHPKRIYVEMLQKRKSTNKTINPSIIKVKKLQKVTESVFKSK